MNADEDSGLPGSCGNGKLRQWLIDQIESKKFPGLVWENDEKSIFRIPWKHAGKQDYNREEDAALFKVRPATPSVSTCSRTCSGPVHTLGCAEKLSQRGSFLGDADLLSTRLEKKEEV